MIGASRANQKFASSVSTRPFSGTGVGRITSYADSRSVVTMRSLSSPTA